MGIDHARYNNSPYGTNKSSTGVSPSYTKGYAKTMPTIQRVYKAYAKW